MSRNPLIKVPRSKLLKACVLSTILFADTAFAADKVLLDMLLQNGAINQKQYDALLKTDIQKYRE